MHLSIMQNSDSLKAKEYCTFYIAQLRGSSLQREGRRKTGHSPLRAFQVLHHDAKLRKTADLPQMLKSPAVLVLADWQPQQNTHMGVSQN